MLKLNRKNGSQQTKSRTASDSAIRLTRLKWWGGPLNLGDEQTLLRLDQLFPDAALFSEADPLTVRLRGVMVREDADWMFNNHNDLIINTTFQFGNEPPVQRLHFMKNDLPKGWVGDYFHDIILSTRDFKDKILTLRIQVYDIDGIPRELVNGVRAAATSTVVAFPHLAPYAGAVAFAVPAFLELMDHLDDHDCILDERLKLEVDQPGTGHKLLQPGYYVCFKNPVASGLSLSQDLRVITVDGKEFDEFSYAVLEVCRDFQAHPQWEVDQKVAKLVAELNGKGQSGKAALEFLRETLDGYSKFRKLQRAKSLQEKASLSGSEQRLLREFMLDPELEPFLPS